MKTSLSETESIEKYLLQTAGPEDSALFQAKLILDQELKSKIEWQKRTYLLIREYGRRQVRAEISGAEIQFFQDSRERGLVEKILSLFSRK